MIEIYRMIDSGRLTDANSAIKELPKDTAKEKSHIDYLKKLILYRSKYKTDYERHYIDDVIKSYTGGHRYPHDMWIYHMHHLMNERVHNHDAPMLNIKVDRISYSYTMTFTYEGIKYALATSMMTKPAKNPRLQALLESIMPEPFIVEEIND